LRGLETSCALNTTRQMACAEQRYPRSQFRTGIMWSASIPGYARSFGPRPGNRSSTAWRWHSHSLLYAKRFPLHKLFLPGLCIIPVHSLQPFRLLWRQVTYRSPNDTRVSSTRVRQAIAPISHRFPSMVQGRLLQWDEAKRSVISSLLRSPASTPLCRALIVPTESVVFFAPDSRFGTEYSRLLRKISRQRPFSHRIRIKKLREPVAGVQK
jgi:hypothetical protein